MSYIVFWRCITILKIYNKFQAEEWNDYVKSFRNWDIYYLYEYAYSFMIHGDGEPLLIVYEDEYSRFCYVVMKNDIANFSAFKEYLKSGEYYDFETPYGYGGPLSDSPVSEVSQKQFLNEINEYCRRNSIVSQFVRFHPLLNNYKLLPHVIESKYLRDTVYIDTSSPEIIMKKMDSKNRNMVRKAIKKGVTIVRKPISAYKDFIPMYVETMRRNGAGEYYTFHDDYFSALKKMKENSCIFFALFEQKPIAAAVIFFNSRNMHYHLSGSYNEYRQYSAGNLLLYEAACWGSESGIQYFHLGGGMKPNDSLFGFKKQFNKTGSIPFVVGRTIFEETSYHTLLNLRKQIDPEFDINNELMIQYRSS